jgi:hypothetical protein
MRTARKERRPLRLLRPWPQQLDRLSFVKLKSCGCHLLMDVFIEYFYHSSDWRSNCIQRHQSFLDWRRQQQNQIVGGGGKSSSSSLLAVATTLAMAYRTRRRAAESDPTTSQHSQASFSSETSGDDSSANQCGPRTPRVHTPDRNSKAKRGLPLWVKKKFLQALEENGGLSSASVFRVCNSNPEVFGSPKSAVRKQIQNHVNFLKESTQREYYNYLNTLGVVPFAELECEEKRRH